MTRFQIGPDSRHAYKQIVLISNVLIRVRTVFSNASLVYDGMLYYLYFLWSVDHRHIIDIPWCKSINESIQQLQVDIQLTRPIVLRKYIEVAVNCAVCTLARYSTLEQWASDRSQSHQTWLAAVPDLRQLHLPESTTGHTLASCSASWLIALWTSTVCYPAE